MIEELPHLNIAAEALSRYREVVVEFVVWYDKSWAACCVGCNLVGIIHELYAVGSKQRRTLRHGHCVDIILVEEHVLQFVIGFHVEILPQSLAHEFLNFLPVAVADYLPSDTSAVTFP